MGVLLFALNYAPPLWPLGRDSGTFGYTASRMLAGEALYRDLWEHKPPGVYLVDLAALSLGFDAHWTLWAVSAAAACAAAALAMAVLLRVFGGRWAWTVGALHALLLIDPNLHQYSNYTETYGLALQWLLLWSLVRQRRPWGDALLAGLCAGAAVVLKQTTAALAIAVGIDALLRLLGPSAGRPAARRTLCAFVAGAALPPLAVASWIAAAGASAEAWDCIFTYNAVYASPDLAGNLLAVLRALVLLAPVYLLGVPALASLLPARVAAGGTVDPALAARLSRIALLALPFECLFIALPGRFYGHYFLTILPVLALRAVVFLPALEGGLARFLPAARRWLAPLLVLLGLIQLDLDLVAGHARVVRERQWEHLSVEAIVSRAGAAQPVLIWGAEPGILLLAQRRAPLYFTHLYPLFTPGYATEATWRRLLADLRREPPEVILEAGFRTVAPNLVPTLDDIVLGGLGAVPDEARAALRDLLAGYRRETTREGLLLWVRQPAPVPS